MDYRLKRKMWNYKTSGKKTVQNHRDLWLGKEFSNGIYTQTIKEKTDRLDFIKITFCSSKDSFKIEKKSQTGRKYL